MPERLPTAADIAALGEDRGAAFYASSLAFAQALWVQGLPAQALLQVNRAFACRLSSAEPVLERWPLPYRTMVWLITHRVDGQFLGNPRRHWQHLATRMVEPFKELRTWRAWACWYLAKALLPEAEFPADARQLREEGIVEPTFGQIRAKLRELSPADDEARWLESLREAGVALPAEATGTTVEIIGEEELTVVRDLAQVIWPQVYPGIISMEQILFMLQQRYELAVLRADVAEKGAIYALIRQGDRAVGYVGIEPRAEELFLQKLYLLPEVAGRGIGALALKWVAAQARARGRHCVRLVVNKRNAQAIRAYRRAGFVFERDVVTEIGRGFVMDDYQMRLDLPPDVRGLAQAD